MTKAIVWKQVVCSKCALPTEIPENARAWHKDCPKAERGKGHPVYIPAPINEGEER